MTPPALIPLWYKDSYQPQREATNDEAKRVIDFARLVNHASDEEFRRQIESFLDVNAFLRFMAATPTRSAT